MSTTPSHQREFGETSPEPAQVGDRPYLRIYYACANQYVRVYRAPGGEAYLARCPSCGACTRFAVGPGGTDRRFFELSCRE